MEKEIVFVAQWRENSFATWEDQESFSSNYHANDYISEQRPGGAYRVIQREVEA